MREIARDKTYKENCVENEFSCTLFIRPHSTLNLEIHFIFCKKQLDDC